VGDDEANTIAVDGVTLSTICVGVSGGVGVATGLCEKPVARRQNESGTREQRRTEGGMTKHLLFWNKRLQSTIAKPGRITRFVELGTRAVPVMVYPGASSKKQIPLGMTNKRAGMTNKSGYSNSGSALRLL
jgi:hypothetical protein